MTGGAGAAVGATRLLLVRHAEAVCNAEDVFVGHGCAGLTAAGHQQVPELGVLIARLCGAARPVLVSSVQRRALETAAGVGRMLDGVIPSRPLCSLCERHPGSVEGRANAEVAAMEQRGTLPADVETRVRFLLRVRHALATLAGRHRGATVVAVTHGGVVSASFWALGGLEARLPFGVQPANASVTEWVRDQPDRPWHLARYNLEA